MGGKQGLPTDETLIQDSSFRWVNRLAQLSVSHVGTLHLQSDLPQVRRG